MSEAVPLGQGAGAVGDDSVLCCCYVTGTCGAVGWVVRCSAGTGPSDSDAGGCC